MTRSVLGELLCFQSSLVCTCAVMRTSVWFPVMIVDILWSGLTASEDMQHTQNTCGRVLGTKWPPQLPLAQQNSFSTTPFVPYWFNFVYPGFPQTWQNIFPWPFLNFPWSSRLSILHSQRFPKNSRKCELSTLMLNFSAVAKNIQIWYNSEGKIPWLLAILPCSMTFPWPFSFSRFSSLRGNPDIK